MERLAPKLPNCRPANRCCKLWRHWLKITLPLTPAVAAFSGGDGGHSAP